MQLIIVCFSMAATHVSQSNIFVAHRPLEKVLFMRKDSVYLLLSKKKHLFQNALQPHSL